MLNNRNLIDEGNFNVRFRVTYDFEKIDGIISSVVVLL